MMLTVWAEVTDWHHFLTPLPPHILSNLSKFDSIQPLQTQYVLYVATSSFACVLVSLRHKNHMVIRKSSCFGLPGSVGTNMAGNIPSIRSQSTQNHH